MYRKAVGDNNSDAKANKHEMLYHFAEVVFKCDLRNGLSKLLTPALVMQAADDLIAPVEVGTYMHEKLKRSKLVNMKVTGHCALLSEPAEQ